MMIDSPFCKAAKIIYDILQRGVLIAFFKKKPPCGHNDFFNSFLRMFISGQSVFASLNLHTNGM